MVGFNTWSTKWKPVYSCHGFGDTFNFRSNSHYMDKEKLLLLIERYLSNQATDAERQELDEWYNRFEELPGLAPGSLTPPVSFEEKRFCRTENPN
jgi:hypothetical protein